MEALLGLKIRLAELEKNYKKVGQEGRTDSWFAGQEQALTEIVRQLQSLELDESDQSKEGIFIKSEVEEVKGLLSRVRAVLKSISRKSAKPDSDGTSASTGGRPGETASKSTSSKMDFSIQEATRMVKEFSGGVGIDGAEAVLVYVAGIKFYAKLLNSVGRDTLVDFIFDTKLTGEARRCFLARPASLEAICDTLLQRFSAKETIAEVTGRLARTTQGGRSVAKFAGELEQLMGRLTRLHLKKQGDGAASVVASMTDDAVCSAFKNGLRPELQGIVIAAGVNSFREAVDKALEGEAAARNVAQVNAYARSDQQNFSRWGYSRGSNGNWARGGYRGYTPQGQYNRGFSTPGRFVGPNRGSWRPPFQGGYQQRPAFNRGNGGAQRGRGQPGRAHAMEEWQEGSHQGQASVVGGVQEQVQINVAQEQFFRD